MIDNWFDIPIYYKDNAFTPQETQQIYDSFINLKNQNKLVRYNGTSLLNYNTDIISILDSFELPHIKDKIRLYCNDYVINWDIRFKNIIIENDWVVGYSKSEYQGEHNHGYYNNGISGVVYAKVPEHSSPIRFSAPNPYLEHICVRNNCTVDYHPKEGMIIIFPNFLKHRVLPNLNIPDNALRLGLAFNARVE